MQVAGYGEDGSCVQLEGLLDLQATRNYKLSRLQAFPSNVPSACLA